MFELNNEHIMLIKIFITKSDELLHIFDNYYRNVEWHKINYSDALLYLYYAGEQDLMFRCLEFKECRCDIVFNIIMCRLFVMCSLNDLYTEMLFNTYEYKWWLLEHSNDFLSELSILITNKNWYNVKKKLSTPIPDVYSKLDTMFSMHYIL
jgi:hypothetical protein